MIIPNIWKIKMFDATNQIIIWLGITMGFLDGYINPIIAHIFYQLPSFFSHR